MTDKTLTLERYDHLSQQELEVRLREEERLLSESTPSEQLYLLHELRVYQIELEMQNRELHEMRAQLEAARDRYASLYDFAPIGYFTLDEHGIIRQLNLTAGRLLGRNPGRLTGYPFVILLEQGEKARFFTFLKRVFAAEEDSVVDEFKLRAARQNETIIAQLKGILSREPGSETPVCRVALIDQTRQRRVEAQAEADRDALAHATRVNKLGELASGVVHELAQPLSAITTYSGILESLIKDGGDKHDKARLARKISEQAERSVTLLQQLRDFARSRPLQKSYQPMDKLVDDALSLIGNKLRHSGIRIVFIAEQSLPEVFVDPIQVTQVLINLLSNSIDAQRKHNIRGKIVISVRPRDTHYLEIRVRDNGPGIDPVMADQLFLPFRTTKPSGLGIGLSLSRSMIEAHHGKIWVDQDVGGGAAFCFTLPTLEGEFDE